MRTITLVLVLAVASFGAVLFSNVPATNLAEGEEFVPTVASAPFLPPESGGFLDILYITKEFDSSFVNGIATSPSYGWISVDDFILEDDSNIEKITYWVIRYQTESGVYHRFWNWTSGQGPQSELDNASVTATLTSTGQYAFGYLVYKMEAEMDYDLDAGHYWAGSYFSSGFWYIMVANNEWDDMAYFDYGGGGSGPWYSSQYMWGAAYGFFQVFEGTSGDPDITPPYVDGMDPADGETGVPLDSLIVFHCKDDDKGVDVSTIDFIARDTSLGAGRAVGLYSPTRVISGDLDIDDADLNDVLCTFTPDDPFYQGDTITCTVDGSLADVKGNEMGEDFVWSFTTYSETVEPTTWGAIKAGI